MKPIYGNIEPATGALYSGICTLKIVPKEWVYSYIDIDFTSNTVLYEPVLLEDKSWLIITLTEKSYEYTETPKYIKAGQYYEINFSGTTNDLSPELLQILETLKYHEFIAITKDRHGRQKLIGNNATGLILSISNKEENADGGTQTVTIQLSMENEFAAPFYNP